MSEPTTLGKRIASARRRSEAKLTQAQIAEALGVTPQAVSGWERDESRPDIHKLEALASLLGTSLEWLIQGLGKEVVRSFMDELSAEFRAGANDEKHRLARDILSGPLQGGRNFPLFRQRERTEGGWALESAPFMHIRRPIILERATTSFGMVVATEEMSPVYRPGDVILLFPLRTDRAMDVLLLDREVRDGEAHCLLRRLLASDESRLRVESYNPQDASQLQASEWPVRYQIIGRYEASFVLRK